jgi:hypothetical protein
MKLTRTPSPRTKRRHAPSALLAALALLLQGPACTVLCTGALAGFAAATATADAATALPETGGHEPPPCHRERESAPATEDLPDEECAACPDAPRVAAEKPPTLLAPPIISMTAETRVRMLHPGLPDPPAHARVRAGPPPPDRLLQKSTLLL